MKGRLVQANIVEILERDGALRFKELFKTVHKMHSDCGTHSFDEILMIMELQGLIRVNNLTKGRRRIELA
jgi:hypothetical protein